MDDKKDDEPPQYPNNVERTLYEIAIEESGKRIDRLFVLELIVFLYLSDY